MATFFPSPAERRTVARWLRRHPILVGVAGLAAVYGIYKLAQGDDKTPPLREDKAGGAPNSEDAEGAGEAEAKEAPTRVIRRNVSWTDQLGGDLVEVMEPAAQRARFDTSSSVGSGSIARSSSTLGGHILPPASEPLVKPSRGGQSPEWGWYVGATISPPSGQQVQTPPTAADLVASAH